VYRSPRSVFLFDPQDAWSEGREGKSIWNDEGVRLATASFMFLHIRAPTLNVSSRNSVDYEFAIRFTA